jgi:copper chaperone CopZ
LLTLIVPLSSQVETVAMHTTGISCGVCAAVSEINLKRMAGVDRVAISLAKEAIIIYYKPGAAFSPRRIREVLQPLEVGVVQFQISARGCVQGPDGKRFFTAGKDRFVLVPPGDAPLPHDTPVLIEAILNDRLEPMELKILSFKPLKP